MDPGHRNRFLLEQSATGEVSVTAFEKLQVGIGPGATVHQLDDVTGAVVPDPALPLFQPPEHPAEICSQM